MKSNAASPPSPIKVYRTARGWSQKELAERIGHGCTQQNVCWWERGRDMPGYRYLPHLARALRKQPEELLREVMEHQKNEAAAA